MEQSIETPPPAGLRETKKARTRQAISDIATGLFIEHGFEQVTIAQIAAAAEVSVKTVFNYFGAKEELFFDRAAELEDNMERAIIERAAGQTVTEALHRLFADNRIPIAGSGWGVLRDPHRRRMIERYVATEEASPTLQAARLMLAEAWAPRLTRTVADAWGVRGDDVDAQAFAVMVLAIMQLRHRTIAAATLGGVSARTIERRVRTAMDTAFARLAAGFAGIDR